MLYCPCSLTRCLGFQLMSKFEEPTSDPEDELMASADSISRKAKIR